MILYPKEKHILNSLITEKMDSLIELNKKDAKAVRRLRKQWNRDNELKIFGINADIEQREKDLQALTDLHYRINN